MFLCVRTFDSGLNRVPLCWEKKFRGAFISRLFSRSKINEKIIKLIEDSNYKSHYNSTNNFLLHIIVLDVKYRRDVIFSSPIYDRSLFKLGHRSLRRYILIRTPSANGV